ncbi:UNKNOWN [Stylonychia lemnae]|uniref:Histidine acid phosphatase family protein n=1 Tax=Stylonychia lemnae TaxID=5949 RepID=A0A078AC95_STYLE|nr:UNKNOWN [Stylonychia lemnae]|eukprot:CDW79461.1 UNKNOWN [Stylonychia lemnae]
MHRNSIKQNRHQSPLRNTKAYDNENAIEYIVVKLQSQLMLKMGAGQLEESRFNFFACEYNKVKHLDLFSTNSQDKYSIQALEYFDKIGIIDKIIQVAQVTKKDFEQLGFRYLNDHSLFYTSSKLIDPTFSNLFNIREWQILNKVISSFQYTSTDKRMRYYYQAMTLQLIIKQLDLKMDCILQNYPQSLKSCMVNGSNPNYQIQSQHDINMLQFANALELETDYIYMNYMSTMIIELHMDVEQKNIGKCIGEDCFYVKIFFDDLELFSELGFCDYRTDRCWFTDFKNFVKKKYHRGRHYYVNQCSDIYDPMELDFINFWKT